MKRILLLCCALIALVAASRQSAADTLLASRTNEAKLAPGFALGVEPHKIVARDDGQRIWEQVKYLTNFNLPIPRVEVITNRYTELGAGICFQAPDGKWTDSQARFVLTADGSVEATEIPHKVQISPDLYCIAAVKMTLPDGRLMSSTFRGLYLYDSVKNERLLVSGITNSIATLVSSNVLVYSNCFTTLKGDLVLKVTPAGIAQDVVIRESLAWIPFDEIAFDPKSTVLEAWTEFYDSPAPDKQTNTLPARAVAEGPADSLSDESLKFGDVLMVPGRAYLSGTTNAGVRLNAPAGARDSVPVGKTWIEQDNRKFLIERLRWREIVPQFRQLETNASATMEAASIRAPRRLQAVAIDSPPPKLLASVTIRTNRAILLAQAALSSSPALIFDYTTVTCSGGTCNGYRFEASETYYLSSPVIIQGQAVLVGGTVIKIAPLDTGAGVTFSGTVDCDTGPGRMVLLTCRDDNSVGSTIAQSNGDPTSDLYGLAGFTFAPGVAVDLRYIRASYMMVAIDLQNSSVNNACWHSQFFKCWGAFSCDNGRVSVYNLLFDHVDYPFQGGNPQISAHHITAHSGSDLALNWGGTGSIGLTNSLVVGFPSCTMCAAPPDLPSSTVWLTTETPGVFETSVLGAHYLPQNSPYRGYGTSPIDGRLRQALRSKTTYPPLPLSSTISTDTILGPIRPRNNGVYPDIGFSYDAVDYVAQGVLVQSGTLLFTNGVVIGLDAGALSSGIRIAPGAEVISEGSPVNMNRFVELRSVQEQHGGASPPIFNAFLQQASTGAASQLRLRFTELPWRAGLGWHVNREGGVGVISVQDCHFFSGGFYANAGGNYEYTLALTNNIFEGSQFTVSGGTGTHLHVWNNTFIGGAMTLYSPNGTWNVRDNLFHQMTLYPGGSFDNDYNAYYQTTPISTGSGNIVLYSPVGFQSGPLGRWYLPAGSTPLLDGGGRLPIDAGLFHHTTQVGQGKEGIKAAGVKVDVGFHYVAVQIDNLALSQPASQSSTESGRSAGRAVDGNTDGNPLNGSVSQTTIQSYPWWQVDVPAGQQIDTVNLWNRTDCCAQDLSPLLLTVIDERGFSLYTVEQTVGRPTSIPIGRSATEVKISKTGTGYIAVAEVQVLSAPKAVDTDHDGLADYYEDRNGNNSQETFETSWTNPDTDYDGRNDGQELSEGTNPISENSFVAMRLGYWVFNDPNMAGVYGPKPKEQFNVQLVPNWSMNALKVDSTSPANLKYRDIEANASANINCRQGTVRFWFRPSWNSNPGPGSPARLIEMGDSATGSGWWALSTIPAGSSTDFTFASRANGGTITTHFSVNSDLVANTWYQIALTYSPSATSLYIDGQPVVTVLNGPDVVNIPNAATRALYGFSIGSNRTGNERAQGQFDEFETFNYPLPASQIYANYHSMIDPANVYVPFSEPYIQSPLVLLNPIGGPTVRKAVLVDTENFDSAVWDLYSDNFGAVLPATEGAHDLWVGFKGLSEKAYWRRCRFYLDTTAPQITLTAPASTTVSKPIIQVQGYANEGVASVMFDVQNANGAILNKPGHILSATYDPVTGEATRTDFQCFDLNLAGGANAITIRVRDPAGNVATVNTTYTFTTSGDSSPPQLSVEWPQNNAWLSGDTFRLGGHVDDETATVTIDGLTPDPIAVSVARNGTFSATDLPLANASQTFTVTAKDAANNPASVQWTVKKSASLIQIDPITSAQAAQQRVTVTGTVTAGVTGVSVNDVPATVSGATFQAFDVPIANDGQAVIRVTATDNQGQGITVSTQIDSDPIVRVSAYRETMYWRDDFINGDEPDCPRAAMRVRNTVWTKANGGRSDDTSTAENCHTTAHVCTGGFSFSPGVVPPQVILPYDWSEFCTIFERVPWNDGLETVIPWEFCDVQETLVLPTGAALNSYNAVFNRFAHTELEVVPGGPEIPGQQVTVLIRASVKEFPAPYIAAISPENFPFQNGFEGSYVVQAEAITTKGEPWAPDPTDFDKVVKVLALPPGKPTSLDIKATPTQRNHVSFKFDIQRPEFWVDNQNKVIDPNTEALGVSNWVTTEGLPNESTFTGTSVDPENFRLSVTGFDPAQTSMDVRLEIKRGQSIVQTLNYTLTTKSGQKFRSRFLRLVSDSADDAASGNGATSDPNNQTIWVRLGDVLKLSYEPAVGQKAESEIAVGRPSSENNNTLNQKKNDIRNLRLRLVVFRNNAGNPCVTRAQVETDVADANERLAQATIRIVPTYDFGGVGDPGVAQPSTLEDGFTTGGSPFQTANEDEQGVIAFKDTDPNTIDVFYVQALNDGGRAVSYRKGRNQTGNPAYDNWIVIDSSSAGGSDPHNLAHEIMHILLNLPHRLTALGLPADPATALFLGGTSLTKAVSGTKRIGPYPGATSADVGTYDTTTIRTYTEVLP